MLMNVSQDLSERLLVVFCPDQRFIKFSHRKARTGTSSHQVGQDHMWTSMSRIVKHYQGIKCKRSPVLPTNSVQPSRGARLQQVLIQLGKQLDCWTIGQLALSESTSLQLLMKHNVLQYTYRVSQKSNEENAAGATLHLLNGQQQVSLAAGKLIFWSFLAKTKQDQALLSNVHRKLAPQHSTLGLHHSVSYFFGDALYKSDLTVLGDRTRGVGKSHSVASRLRRQAVFSFSPQKSSALPSL